MARNPELCERLDSHWRAFASTLPSQTKVIDLGCGTGAVGRALLQGQPQLHVTGVDIAQVPSSDQPALELLSNVPMERLRFAERSFGAAVSQFGYEYGDAGSAAAELARVLMPGAQLSLLVHHPEGPLIGDMRRHRRAIEGLCGPRVEVAFLAGNADAIVAELAAVKRESSNDPLLELAERGLQAHIRRDERGRSQVWKAVQEALAPELVMLDSLELCRRDDHQIDHVVNPLARWFDVTVLKALKTTLGEPIAWIIKGKRHS
jgi:SAM-dependent methyltransferase